MKIKYRICVPSDLNAGIRGFSDQVIVEIKSGDPGGEKGEFEKHIRESLNEWYDSGDCVQLDEYGI